MIAAARPLVPLAPSTMFGAIDQVLRDRDGILARIAAGKDLAAITRTMVATIALAMAIVGAALGLYRGGIQILYAGIKLPLVLLGTAALSAPALTAIGAALGRRSRLASDLALVVTALAFGALLMASCAPLILAAKAFDLSYHRMILLVVGLFTCAGLASLRVVVGAVAREHGPGGGAAIAGLCIVFALVGGQLAWALRPYLVRPRAPEVPFLRPVEDSLFDGITGAVRSARGIYVREFAPLPGEGMP
ncbi:MAG: hypothetical protein SFX73_29260 [Kofleriaceae bacterium]|nr:hypothetical protein [Kofleriaceae bacterium]